MATKDDIITELRGIVDAQAQRIADLERKLAKALKNSSNSSKPPSSDIVSRTKCDKKDSQKDGE